MSRQPSSLPAAPRSLRASTHATTVSSVNCAQAPPLKSSAAAADARASGTPSKKAAFQSGRAKASLVPSVTSPRAYHSAPAGQWAHASDARVPSPTAKPTRRLAPSKPKLTVTPPKSAARAIAPVSPVKLAYDTFVPSAFRPSASSARRRSSPARRADLDSDRDSEAEEVDEEAAAAEEASADESDADRAAASGTPTGSGFASDAECLDVDARSDASMTHTPVAVSPSARSPSAASMDLDAAPLGDFDAFEPSAPDEEAADEEAATASPPVPLQKRKRRHPLPRVTKAPRSSVADAVWPTSPTRAAAAVPDDGSASDGSAKLAGRRAPLKSVLPPVAPPLVVLAPSLSVTSSHSSSAASSHRSSRASSAASSSASSPARGVKKSLGVLDLAAAATGAAPRLSRTVSCVPSAAASAAQPAQPAPSLWSTSTMHGARAQQTAAALAKAAAAPKSRRADEAEDASFRPASAAASAAPAAPRSFVSGLGASRPRGSASDTLAFEAMVVMVGDTTMTTGDRGVTNRRVILCKAPDTTHLVPVMAYGENVCAHYASLAPSTRHAYSFTLAPNLEPSTVRRRGIACLGLAVRGYLRTLSGVREVPASSQSVACVGKQGIEQYMSRIGALDAAASGTWVNLRGLILRAVKCEVNGAPGMKITVVDESGCMCVVSFFAVHKVVVGTVFYAVGLSTYVSSMNQRREFTVHAGTVYRLNVPCPPPTGDHAAAGAHDESTVHLLLRQLAARGLPALLADTTLRDISSAPVLPLSSLSALAARCSSRAASVAASSSAGEAHSGDESLFGAVLLVFAAVPSSVSECFYNGCTHASDAGAGLCRKAVHEAPGSCDAADEDFAVCHTSLDKGARYHAMPDSKLCWMLKATLREPTLAEVEAQRRLSAVFLADGAAYASALASALAARASSAAAASSSSEHVIDLTDALGGISESAAERPLTTTLFDDDVEYASRGLTAETYRRMDAQARGRSMRDLAAEVLEYTVRMSLSGHALSATLTRKKVAAQDAD